MAFQSTNTDILDCIHSMYIYTIPDYPIHRHIVVYPPVNKQFAMDAKAHVV